MTNDGVGAGEDDSVFSVLDEYGIEYQSEHRHGRKWLQVRAGSDIGVHIVDGLRGFGYRLHSFASDTTINFVKVDDECGGGVRGREEIRRKLEDVQERLEHLGQRLSEVNNGHEGNSKNIYDAVVSVRKAIAGMKVCGRRDE